MTKQNIFAGVGGVAWSGWGNALRGKGASFMPLMLVALVAVVLSGGAVFAGGKSLPKRATPPPETSKRVPHVQLWVETIPEINAELLRRVAALPKVEIRPTVVSLPGAKGFWLMEELALSRPDVIVGGREFAHMHPDGSLHASLSPERARQAVKAGWAVRHPWADKRRGWEGFVLLFTPQTMEELDVTFQLVVDGYNFVTGKSVRARDIGARR